MTRESACWSTQQAHTAPARRVEERSCFDVGTVVEHSLDSELQPVTSFEHCLAVNISNRPRSLIMENNLFIFERRDTLNAIFIAARSKRGFHSRACIRVVLNSESGRESVCATGANETRVVESHYNHDAVAYDPFVNRAQRDLTLQVALIGEPAYPNWIGKTHARGTHADPMTIANMETGGCFETLRSIAQSGLPREDQFNLIGNRRSDGEVQSCIGRAVRIAGDIAFEHAVCFGAGI